MRGNREDARSGAEVEDIRRRRRPGEASLQGMQAEAGRGVVPRAEAGRWLDDDDAAVVRRSGGGDVPGRRHHDPAYTNRPQAGLAAGCPTLVGHVDRIDGHSVGAECARDRAVGGGPVVLGCEVDAQDGDAGPRRCRGERFQCDGLQVVEQEV